MKILGVDGAKDAWIAVVWEPSHPPVASACAGLRDLVEDHPDAEVITVDIPIGLPRGGHDYPREADPLAKKSLGRDHRSIAYPPPREVLEAPTIERAREIADRIGVKVQRQAYALRRGILEIDDLIRELGKPGPFREVHPEISFRALAKEQGTEVRHSKRTWNGFVERYGLLAEAGLHVELTRIEDGDRIGPDDVLDAAVAAWSARRIAEGRAEALAPEGGPRIWF